MKKPGNKMRKADFENRFSVMVGEYHSAKEILQSLTEGTPDYIKQNRKCESLFSAAERFINTKRQSIQVCWPFE